jgi:hypothetical protein
MSYTPEINKLHSLCIAHDKLTKDRNRIILRLRALMEEIFPEYLKCVHVEIKTSLYLLGKYYLPEHFQKLDIDEEEWNIRRISNGKHNANTLKKIKEHAHKSIGAGKTGEEDGVRITLDAWISQLRLIGECRDLNLFTHYKQIEKMGGSNIRLRDSGKYSGMRRLNKLGNKRLLKLIYILTTHAVKYMPEVS